jgi:hypothetical protein
MIRIISPHADQLNVLEFIQPADNIEFFGDSEFAPEME